MGSGKQATVLIACTQPGMDRTALEREWGKFSAELSDADGECVVFPLSPAGGRGSRGDLAPLLQTLKFKGYDLINIGLADHANCSAAAAGLQMPWEEAALTAIHTLDEYGYGDAEVFCFTVRDEDWTIDRSTLRQALFLEGEIGQIIDVVFDRIGALYQ